MSQKSYYSISGTIFLIVAVVHLLRIVNGWELNIGNFAAPVWASWVGLIVAGYLSYNGLKRKG